MPRDHEGPAYYDVMGRPLAVEDFPCGCCGTHIAMNVWSYWGHGSARCTACRIAGCKLVPHVRRCGATVTADTHRGFYTGVVFTEKPAPRRRR